MDQLMDKVKEDISKMKTDFADLVKNMSNSIEKDETELKKKEEAENCGLLCSIRKAAIDFIDYIVFGKIFVILLFIVAISYIIYNKCCRYQRIPRV